MISKKQKTKQFELQKAEERNIYAYIPIYIRTYIGRQPDEAAVQWKHQLVRQNSAQARQTMREYEYLHI